jgi:hypothetical protein
MLVRYHGVFAPRSSVNVAPRACDAEAADACHPTEGVRRACTRVGCSARRLQRASAPALSARVLAARVLTEASDAQGVLTEATMITVAHWGRLGDGELFARDRYIEWPPWRRAGGSVSPEVLVAELHHVG